MRICDLTVPELNRYREMCNFLDDELIYFDMKSRDKSNIQIAIALNVSEGQIPRIGGRSMDDGWSYRRGRDMRTGRYISRDGGSYRGYIRGAARDRMMERLEEAMEDAGSESEHHAIMRCMEKLED